MNEHSQSSYEELGAYLVGALELDEAEQMQRHLGECTLCRANYAELAPVVDVLAATPAEALTYSAAIFGDELPSPGRPNEAMWERLRRRAGIENAEAQPKAVEPVGTRWRPGRSQGLAFSRTGRPRLRIQRPVHAATAAVCFGVLVVAATVIHEGLHRGGSAETVSASNAADGVSASVEYWPTDWGTSLQIAVKGGGDRCVLYAVGANGEKVVASSWWAPQTIGESVAVPGGVAMHASDIADFQVASSSGDVLLTIPAS